jgi:hypothetical protein
VYEDRKRWQANAVLEGMAPEAAYEASLWLLGKQDAEAICTGLAEVADAAGVDVRLVELDDFVQELPFLFSHHSSGLLLWNITDGHSLFRGSHLAGLAEFADIPYFGNPPYAQALGQDKYKFHLLCSNIGSFCKTEFIWQ